MILRFTFSVIVLLFVLSFVLGQPPAKIVEVEKAEAKFREGKPEDAFNLLQDAVKKNPQLPPAPVMMARLHFSAGQPGPGRARLEQAAVEAPYHPEVYLTNASQALAEGRFSDAVLNCQAALTLSQAERWSADQKNSFQREARAGLSAAFEAKHDWESARTNLLALLEFEPKNSTARQRLARAFLALARETEAFQELQHAAKDDPTVLPPESLMGLMYSQKGNSKLAEEWLEKAVQKYPQDARAHRTFGGWLLDRGRLEAAKIHINIAAQREPKARESLVLEGMLARYTKDYEAAVKIFGDMMREEPGDFFVSNQWTLACVELPGKRQGAIQQAELNAKLYPRGAEALATLGWAYFRAGRLDEAEKALSASLSGGQVSPDTAYYLARFWKEKSMPSNAKDILKKALDSDAAFVNRADAKTLWDELGKSK